jgi:hypothetical protein
MLQRRREPPGTDLKLPDNLFVEVLGSSICAQSDKISSINMLFLHAPLTLLDAGDTLLLQSSCFSLLLRLSPFGWILLVRRRAVCGPNSQHHGQVSAADAIPAVGRPVGLSWKSRAGIVGLHLRSSVVATCRVAGARLLGVTVSHLTRGAGFAQRLSRHVIQTAANSGVEETGPDIAEILVRDPGTIASSLGENVRLILGDRQK